MSLHVGKVFISHTKEIVGIARAQENKLWTRWLDDGIGSILNSPFIRLMGPSDMSKAPSQAMAFQFGIGFLHDHVGQILDDPSVAILELVANCYDAGADSVVIEWPRLPGDLLSVTDNGTGMTREEFEKRWKTLAYDRQLEQGSDVVFPPGKRKMKGRRLDTTAKDDLARCASQTSTELRLGRTVTALPQEFN